MKQPPRGLIGRAIGYFAVREFIPLYGVYSLLFRDSGLSTGQISTLLVIWSVTSFAMEVPSGAWADSVSRRGLLALSSLLYALGFSLWTAVPGYPGFAAGFVLWGSSGALMSGTFEALLYDELVAASATERYAAVMGWANASAMIAALLGTLLGTPLYDIGGYRLVGWVSVAVALAQLVLAWSLPAASAADPTPIPPLPATPPADPAPIACPPLPPDSFRRRYAGVLLAGLSEVARDQVLRRGLLVMALLLGLLAYDEYFPIVAREDGAATGTVPLLMALTVLGEVGGTALAGRTAAMRNSTMSVALTAAGVLIATGIWAGQVAGTWAGRWAGASVAEWAGFALVGLGYGITHNAIVVAEARLQDAMSGAARATVTSVSGLLSEIVTVSVFGVFAVGSSWFAVSTVLMAMTVPMLGIASILRRWLPTSSRQATATE